MSRVWLGLSFVQLTSADDHVSHLVAQHLYEAGLAAGDGKYTAMCGRTVLAASMATAPGRTCPLCGAGVNAPRS